MALFGTQRDAKFLASVNRELINAIVDTEIEFYKLIVENTESNIYGESDSKSYYDSILLPCMITKDDKTATMDDYGHSYTRTLTFGISRDLLERADFYPEVGDIVFWDNEYYELDNVDANQCDCPTTHFWDINSLNCLLRSSFNGSCTFGVFIFIF